MNAKLAAVLKWVGILDGVLLAADTALGTQVPAWQPETHAVAIVLGTIATLLAAWQNQSAPKS